MVVDSSTQLRRILEDEGRRQNWLADRAGIHESRISLIVNRGLQPTEDEAKRIAEVLGRDVSELFDQRESA